MSTRARGPAVDRYVCVPVRMWEELRVSGLGLAPAPAALYMWLATGPMTARVPGVIVGGPLGIAEAIGWPTDATAAALDALESGGVILTDRVARLVYLPAFFAADCSQPTSPSTAAMWSRELASLPKCDLRERVRAEARNLIAALGPTWVAAFDSGVDPQRGKPKLPRKSPDDTPSQAGNQGGNQTANQGGDQSGDPLSLSLALSLDLKDADLPAGECGRDRLKLVTEPSKPRFDFEGVYLAHYPRREGKSQGMKLCISQITTTADFEAWSTAVKNYAQLVRTEGRDTKHVKHFGSFMTSWRDYVDAPTAAKPPTRSGALRSADDVLADALGVSR